MKDDETRKKSICHLLSDSNPMLRIPEPGNWIGDCLLYLDTPEDKLYVADYLMTFFYYCHMFRLKPEERLHIGDCIGVEGMFSLMGHSYRRDDCLPPKWHIAALERLGSDVFRREYVKRLRKCDSQTECSSCRTAVHYLIKNWLNAAATFSDSQKAAEVYSTLPFNVVGYRRDDILYSGQEKEKEEEEEKCSAKDHAAREAGECLLDVDCEPSCDCDNVCECLEECDCDDCGCACSFGMSAHDSEDEDSESDEEFVPESPVLKKRKRQETIDLTEDDDDADKPAAVHPAKLRAVDPEGTGTPRPAPVPMNIVYKIKLWLEYDYSNLKWRGESTFDMGKKLLFNLRGPKHTVDGHEFELKCTGKHMSMKSIVDNGKACVSFFECPLGSPASKLSLESLYAYFYPTVEQALAKAHTAERCTTPLSAVKFRLAITRQEGLQTDMKF